MRAKGLIAMLAGLLLAVPAAVAQTATYRVEFNASPAGTSVRSYYHDLVALVLARTEADFGPARLAPVPGSVPQGRLLAQLEHGQLDLLWTTTSIGREKLARPIRIPVDMGLTGQRALVIRAADVARFDAITDLSKLSELKACQGAHWPDNDVLRYAGLRVAEYDWIDLAYPALRAGDCDYLPRAANEIDGEVAAMGGGDVVVYDRLLLSYRLPMYLFVSRKNEKLAERLQAGLEGMVADGALRHFMEDHPATRSVFRRGRFHGTRVLRLENPQLPPETPLGDPRLWLDLSVLEPPA